MKKNVRIIYFSILLLGILDLMLAFFIKKNTYNLENTVIIAGLSAIIIILISNFGLKRDKRYLKTTTTIVMSFKNYIETIRYLQKNMMQSLNH